MNTRPRQSTVIVILTLVPAVAVGLFLIVREDSTDPAAAYGSDYSAENADTLAGRGVATIPASEESLIRSTLTSDVSLGQTEEVADVPGKLNSEQTHQPLPRWYALRSAAEILVNPRYNPNGIKCTSDNEAAFDAIIRPQLKDYIETDLEYRTLAKRLLSEKVERGLFEPSSIDVRGVRYPPGTRFRVGKLPSGTVYRVAVIPGESPELDKLRVMKRMIAENGAEIIRTFVEQLESNDSR